MHVLHFPVTDAQFAKLQDFLDHGYVCQLTTSTEKLQRFLDHGWSVKSGRVEWLKDDHASTTSNVDSINQPQDFLDRGYTSATSTEKLQRFIDHGRSALYSTTTSDEILDVSGSFTWIKNDGTTLIGRASRRDDDAVSVLRLLHEMMSNRLTAFVHIDQVGLARITSIGAWEYDLTLGWFCDVTFRKS